MKINLEKYFKKYSYNVNKVVGVDPYDANNLLLLENGILSQIIKKEVKQEYLVASYLPNQEVITYELIIQKNLLEKIELEDYIETKCYEEVGLDEAEEYIFKHKVVESAVDEKNLTVEVVIIPQNNIETKYQPLKDSFGYLDYLAYPGYIFDVLYEENIIEANKDLYIYITKEDIFITLYVDGKFYQTSIIPEGLENIFGELESNIKNPSLTFEVFLDLLVKKGLNENNYREEEKQLFSQVSEIFSNKFLVISNQINFLTRKFSLATIDKVYMSTVKGVMPGISEFANMYLGYEADDLKFDLNYNPNNIEIDQIMFLSMLKTQNSYKSENLIDNFSIYERAPTFFYRQSGQLISISIASLFVAMLYPIYQEIDVFFINQSNQTYQKELNNLKHTNSNLKKMNDKLLSKFLSQQNEKTALNKYIDDRKSIIDTIYKEKKGYIPKASLISNVSKYLDKNDVYLSSIQYGDITPSDKKSKKEITKTSQKNSGNIEANKAKFLILNVYSKKEAHITNFVNEVVKNEHLIMTTPGYINMDGNYTAKISIKVER